MSYPESRTLCITVEVLFRLSTETDQFNGKNSLLKGYQKLSIRKTGLENQVFDWRKLHNDVAQELLLALTVLPVLDGVQWCDHNSLQLGPSGLKWGLTIVAQNDLELLGSSGPPMLTSQSVGII
ncbi:hypothetical protein AAY473_031567, partial [Plecturocebus cupreus]